MEIIIKSSVHFKFFDKLCPDFVSNISFIFVFGRKGNEIIIVTKDDNVFAFGDNAYGCLGLGHNNPVKEPTKVNELCNKNVIHICYGYEFVIALTKSGQCFSWGRNHVGMLGNGTQTNCFEPKLINSLSNEVIIAISCGYCHSIVLTQSGKVYSFGSNRYGNIGVGNDFKNQLTPTKIIGLDLMKIVSISSGADHSLALTDKGEVFSWGHNSFGQLGIGNNTNHSIPIKVNLNEGVIIKQITCGLNHSLLLSSEGHIYAFGHNNCGQLGNENKINQNIAIKLNDEIKFKEIASNSSSHISLALSQNGFCYIWGECDGQVIITPKGTHFHSIDDCFVIHSKIKSTRNLLRFYSNTPKNRVTQNLIKSFDKKEKSDLKFEIENKYIYVHKTVLILLCKHFESMLSENWSERESNEIQINEYSYSTYYSFLRYVYTDSIDVKVEEAIDLFDLANSYLEEELKEKCIEVIKNGISIENFCCVYSFAEKYELQELENFCFSFASNRMNDIYKTESFERMEKTSLLRLIKKCGK